MEKHEIIISQTPEGFVAAATSSPYFCFVGNSEAEVKAKVSRAVAFYDAAHAGPLETKLPPPIQITRLVPSQRLVTRELEVA